MLFKPEHVQMILEGRKTATRRAWKSPRVKVGNIYKCKTKMLSKEYFARIKVISVVEQPLKLVYNADAIEEGYSSLEDFKNIWIKINGSWNPEQWVYVIKFILLKGGTEHGN